MDIYQATFSGPLSALLQGRGARDAVEQLARLAARHELSGLLIVEEGHFCHYVEGDKCSIAKVRALAGQTPEGSYSLTLDEGYLVTGRRMQGWYAQCAVDEPFSLIADDAYSNDVPPAHPALIAEARPGRSLMRA